MITIGAIHSRIGQIPFTKLAGQTPLAAPQAQENLEKRTTFTPNIGISKTAIRCRDAIGGHLKIDTR